MQQADIYFDESFGETRNEEAEPQIASSRLLEDHSQNPEHMTAQADFQNHFTLAINECLKAMNERSRDILQSRFLREDDEKESLKILSKKYGISQERVRQLEVQALE